VTGAARIAILYAAIAVLATIANLGSQMVVIALYAGPYNVQVSILVGTAVGLPIKYVLEKRHVFEFQTRDLSHDGRLFVLYTSMGVLTTLFFWAVEYLFHWAFGTDLMRYVGGAIGLSGGYYAKYRLDKRYVFVRNGASIAAVRG
jgi:putative flippase GtrA